ncbi:MAG: type II secretion system F family protein [Candidatus Riflebacteria bacterium]|nr:type II secretion system F family protein [Candidatus Riflebacteria bacterium]
MPKYFVKFADEKGKIKESLIETFSLSQLNEEMKTKGYFVFSVVPQKRTFKESLFGLLQVRETVSFSDLMEFSKLFKTLIKGGLTIKDALEVIIQEMAAGNFLVSLRQVKSDIDDGLAFSSALAKHPRIFPEIFVKSIMAGEKAGALEEILNRLVSFFKNSISLRRKILAALIYPSVLLIVAAISISYMLIKVVPEFSELFNSLNVPLPLFTSFILSLSDFVSGHIFYEILGLFLFVFVSKKTFQTQAGKKFFDGIKLKIPVLRNLEEKFAFSQFSRTLATLLEGGVPLLEALKVVLESLGNSVIKERLETIPEEIQKGETFSKALKKASGVPLALIKMAHVGEESGRLGEMLNNLADHYDEEIEELTSTLTSLIEPLLFLFLAVVVGSIIIALLLPVLTAASNIR